MPQRTSNGITVMIRQATHRERERAERERETERERERELKERDTERQRKSERARRLQKEGNMYGDQKRGKERKRTIAVVSQ